MRKISPFEEDFQKGSSYHYVDTAERDAGWTREERNMADYVLIESRDPFENNVVSHQYDLAANLVREGNKVTLFLVQNGVLPARPGILSSLLTNTAEAGVEVLADDFSLRERGIAVAKLAAGVRAASLSIVIDQLAGGRKAIWH
jgi:sulfur relay (sulfurtransferase) complex TusBCD TusD component (DsrE family)